WVVARAVFGPGKITYHRVIGAILLYLTIGVVFMALYTLVGALAPGSFSGLKVHDRVSLPPDRWSAPWRRARFPASKSTIGCRCRPISSTSVSPPSRRWALA